MEERIDGALSKEGGAYLETTPTLPSAEAGSSLRQSHRKTQATSPRATRKKTTDALRRGAISRRAFGDTAPLVAVGPGVAGGVLQIGVQTTRNR